MAETVVCEEVTFTVVPGEFIWERGEVAAEAPFNGDPVDEADQSPTWTNVRYA